MRVRNRPTRDIKVTGDHKAAADAAIAIYLQVASHINLIKISEVTGIPMSDLYGACRRRAGYGDPDVDLTA